MCKETIKDVLVRLSSTNSSSESDSRVMQGVLRHLGWDSAVVTSGVVYLDGVGTLENPPADIHTYAKALVQNI